MCLVLHYSDSDSDGKTETVLHRADETVGQASEGETVVNIGSVHVIGDSAAQNTVAWAGVGTGGRCWSFPPNGTMSIA